MNQRDEFLIQAWLDNCLDDETFAELEDVLETSAAARQRFWELAELHGDLHEAAKTRFGPGGRHATEPSRRAPGSTTGGSDRHARGRRLRRHVGLLAAGIGILAGGCGLGTIATSVSYAYSGWSPQKVPITLLHDSFEQPPFPRANNAPKEPGFWSGDVTQPVGPEQGITPSDGQTMLRFISTAPEGESPAFHSASEIWRFIDLDGIRKKAGRPADAELPLTLSAAFNGIPAQPGRQPQCELQLVATDSSPAAGENVWLGRSRKASIAGNPRQCLVSAYRTEAIDRDPASWQQLTVTVTAPPAARYLLLHCLVSDNSLDVAEPSERLPGNYVDDIRLRAE